MYQHILVPVDGSPTATKGLDEALRLAKLTGAELRLLYVVDELMFVTSIQEYAAYTADLARALKEGGADILAKALATAQAAGVKADTQLVDSFNGRVADVIIEQAAGWPADLIVLGTHGRRGLRRLALGSDAEQVVRNATVPVLLVRGHD
ncbi:MAG: universal stress protein [Rhizobacter sp.]|nr:universal stress protein [Rhizobacter sp.]